MGTALSAWKEAFKGTAKSIKERGAKLRETGAKVSSKATDTLGALEKEGKFGPAIHEQCLGALATMKAKDSSIEKKLQESYAYAVIPSVSKANLVLGAAYGFGEVFKGGRVVGYAGLVEFTLGVQVGGETFDVILAFDNAETFKRFKGGKYGFAANAAIAILKAKAEATHGFGAGTTIWVLSEGGLQIVAAIGLQKFIFKPAALGWARTDHSHTKAGLSKAAEGGEEEEEPTASAAGEEQEETPEEGERKGPFGHRKLAAAAEEEGEEEEEQEEEEPLAFSEEEPEAKPVEQPKKRLSSSRHESTRHKSFRH